MDYSNKVPQPSHLNCLLHQWMTGTLGSRGDIAVSLIDPCVMDEGSFCHFHIVLLHLTLKLWQWGMDSLDSLYNSGQNGILKLIILEMLFSDWTKALFFTMLGIWNTTSAKPDSILLHCVLKTENEYFCSMKSPITLWFCINYV